MKKKGSRAPLLHPLICIGLSEGENLKSEGFLLAQTFRKGDKKSLGKDKEPTLAFRYVAEYFFKSKINFSFFFFLQYFHHNSDLSWLGLP